MLCRHDEIPDDLSQDLDMNTTTLSMVPDNAGIHWPLPFYYRPVYRSPQAVFYFSHPEMEMGWLMDVSDLFHHTHHLA